VVDVPPCWLSDMMMLLWGRNRVRLGVDLVFVPDVGEVVFRPIKCLQRNGAEYMLVSEPIFSISGLTSAVAVSARSRSKVTKGLSARIVLSPVDRIAFPRDLTNRGLSQRSCSRFLPCRPGVSHVRNGKMGRQINAGFAGLRNALASDQVYFVAGNSVSGLDALV